MTSTLVLDANETSFWLREFEHIKAKTYDIEYPELPARRMFPVTSEGGVGVQSITYQVWDKTGIAKFISDYAKGIPRVEVKGHEVTVPVKRMALGFGMSLDEIKAAARTGRPLSAQKAMAVREGHEYELNQVAFNGESTLNLQGLFSHASIPNGSATTGSWTNGTTTAAQILFDAKGGFSQITSSTYRIEIPNAMGVPGTYYDHIAMTPLSAYSDTTIFDWLIQKVPYLSGPDSIFAVNEFEAVTSLAGSAISSMPVCLYYRKDASKLELEIPEDINFLPPQMKGLEQESIGTMTTGGLNVYKPLSLYIQKMTV